MKWLDQAEVNGKNVLCRLDFNVPFTKDDQIEDTNRIDAALPTIRYILDHGAAHITILAHRGQPKIYPDPVLSLEKVATYLAAQFDNQSGPKFTPGAFAEHLGVYTITDSISLVENIRFTPKDEANDAGFAQELTKDIDIFIFDAFAVAHRAHASTVGVTKFLPSFAGLLVQKELEYLESLRQNPSQPFMVLMGGAKIGDKIATIKTLSDHVDKFLIGGAIANTLLKADGQDVKQSLIDEDSLDLAKSLLTELGEKIVLPTDHVWDGEAIIDIGPQTIQEFEDILTDAKTVFWNGNLGKTEDRAGSKGSLMIGDMLARSPHTTRVVSGGDTVGFLDHHHLAEQMTFVSTGGGATLDYLAGKSLPALAVLQ